MKSEITKRLRRAVFERGSTSTTSTHTHGTAITKTNASTSIPPTLRENFTLYEIAAILNSAERPVVYYGAGLSCQLGMRTGVEQDAVYGYIPDVLVDRFVTRVLEEDASVFKEYLEASRNMLSFDRTRRSEGHLALAEIASAIGAPLVTTNTDLVMHGCGYLPTNLNDEVVIVPEDTDVLLCVGVGVDHHGLIRRARDAKPRDRRRDRVCVISINHLATPYLADGDILCAVRDSHAALVQVREHLIRMKCE
eukprot:Opistho-2@26688